MTGQSWKAQQYWPGWTAVPCLAHPWPAHPPRLPHSQGLRGPLRQRWSQAVPPPPSGLVWGWDQSGVCGGRSGHRRGRGRAGGDVSRQAPRWPRAWSRLRVSGPLHEGWGRDQTASALARLPLKVTAAPGPLLSLCQGLPLQKTQQALPQGPCQSPGLQGACQEGEQSRALSRGERGDPVRTWEAVGHTCGAGRGGQSKKAHSSLAPVLPTGDPRPPWW